MTPPRPTPDDTRQAEPRSVLLFVVGVALLFLFGGLLLQLLLGEGGLLAAEWLLLFMPALVWVRRSGLDPVRTLSLRRPAPVQLAAGVVLALGALPLVWLLGWLQSFVLPVPPEVLEALEELVTADSPARLAWLLVTLALTPAICEEVVFRGVLLAGTRRLAPWRMVLLNGLVFGAFHLSLATAARFLPTAALGCLLAWAVWRSGSLWVGVTMHFVNNATLVVLASIPGLLEPWSDPTAPPPLSLTGVGAVAFAVGVWILATGPARPDP